MPYLTELHAHTAETSRCGEDSAAQLVQNYVKQGYSTLVVTDHFSHRTFDPFFGATHREKVDILLSGYRAAKQAAKGTGLHVLLGMELRFTAPGNINDYLVYGVTEDFLYRSEELLDMRLKSFMPLAHKNGMLVYQAHPFRDGIRIVDPALLDGFEIYNACVRHDSRNAIAKIWAEKHKKPGISGSDYHKTEDTARGGIETDTEIRTNGELLAVLRAGEYRLIRK